MELLEKVQAILEERQQSYFDISDCIWEFAELAYEENRSASIQADYMARQGFHIVQNAADIPTAFIAEWGSGHPIIGICGEYDALPGMSQQADCNEFRPVVEGGAGHACGHHLLGTAAMAAVDALKTAMEREAISGTIRYYGCPAEEYGSGKGFMAKAGVFDDLDIALCWHPYHFNAVELSGALAVLMTRYTFHGISANPSHSGHLGRSALDAAELMGVGANYLREHIPRDAMLHYAYQNSGGVAANVIPAKVEVNYIVRAEQMSTAIEVAKRVDKIAEGAALMTETTVEYRVGNALANYLSNPVVENSLRRNMESIPLPHYTDEELEYARSYRGVTDPKNIESYGRLLKETLGLKGAALQAELNKPISDILLPGAVGGGSTDFGDVSQIVPSGQIYTACFTLGCPPHSWQACAVGKSPIAHKGELYAAKVLAATALDFLRDPELIQEAKRAFEEEMAEHPYRWVLPDDATPKGYGG